MIDIIRAKAMLLRLQACLLSFAAAHMIAGWIDALGLQLGPSTKQPAAARAVGVVLLPTIHSSDHPTILVPFDCFPRNIRKARRAPMNGPAWRTSLCCSSARPASICTRLHAARQQHQSSQARPPCAHSRGLQRPALHSAQSWCCRVALGLPRPAYD